MNSMLGSTNRNTIRLLNAAGYDVVVPGEQICCGALANHAGLRDTATEMASKNIGAFPLKEVDAIIINAAGCGAMLKEYPLLIDGDGDGAAFPSEGQGYCGVSGHHPDLRTSNHSTEWPRRLR